MVTAILIFVILFGILGIALHLKRNSQCIQIQAGDIGQIDHITRRINGLEEIVGGLDDTVESCVVTVTRLANMSESVMGVLHNMETTLSQISDAVDLFVGDDTNTKTLLLDMKKIVNEFSLNVHNVLTQRNKETMDDLDHMLSLIKLVGTVLERLERIYEDVSVFKVLLKE